MTKRQFSVLSVGAAAAAMLFSERAAFSSDTIWDLLRNSDPSRKRVSGPMTLKQMLSVAQPGINTQTGAPLKPGPAVKKKHGGVVGLFDTMGTTLRKVG